MRTFTLISWLGLLVGIAAWVGLVFFWYTIEGKRETRTQRLHAIEQSAQRQLNAAHMKALLKETSEARTALDEMTSSDILSAVEMIEGSGKPLGLNVHISSATPTGVFSKGSSLHSVAFELDSEGNYSSLMRLMQILESLPLLTTIERVELHAEADSTKPDAKALWHLDARVKLFTTATVTS